MAPRPMASFDPNEIAKEEIKGFHFKRYVSCRYDTIQIDPGESIVEHIAFIIPAYQAWKEGKVKTRAETNMECGGQLCMPNYARWRHIRIYFEANSFLDDACRFEETATIRLIRGQNTHAWEGSLGTMVPILPKGGKEKIGKALKEGMIKFWDWREAPLDLWMGPTEMFHVSISYSRPFEVRAPLRIKIALGPFIYRP